MSCSGLGAEGLFPAERCEEVDVFLGLIRPLCCSIEADDGLGFKRVDGRLEDLLGRQSVGTGAIDVGRGDPVMDLLNEGAQALAEVSVKRP